MHIHKKCFQICIFFFNLTKGDNNKQKRKSFELCNRRNKQTNKQLAKLQPDSTEIIVLSQRCRTPSMLAIAAYLSDLKSFFHSSRVINSQNWVADGRIKSLRQKIRTVFFCGRTIFIGHGHLNSPFHRGRSSRIFIIGVRALRRWKESFLLLFFCESIQKFQLTLIVAVAACAFEWGRFTGALIYMFDGWIYAGDMGRLTVKVSEKFAKKHMRRNKCFQNDLAKKTWNSQRYFIFHIILQLHILWISQ